MAMKLKIKKGDQVVVLAGRDKGKRGEVLRMMVKEARLVVSGVNMVKRHQRPSATAQGGIIQKEAPIHVSNVAHIDPKDGKAVRTGYKMVEGRKVRFARRSGDLIDR